MNVANILPWKGHSDFLHAAALVYRRNPETHFVVAGAPSDAKLFAGLLSLRESLGLCHCFHFLGEVDFVQSLYSEASVFCLLSQTEGLPNVVLEAMAAGVPVVATDTGGTREVVLNGRTGFFTEVGRPDEAAEHIAWLLLSPELARQMSVSARNRVESIFSIDEMITTLEGIYDSSLVHIVNHPLVVVGGALVSFAVAGVAYSYVGYPLLLWTHLITGAAPSLRSRNRYGVDIIIAAHNEEAGIREKLDATLHSELSARQISRYLLRLTDRQTKPIRLFASIRTVASNCSKFTIGWAKTNAQNKAVSHARHPILVFSDATTRYDTDALQYLAGAYLDPRVGAVSGRYDYFDPTAARLPARVPANSGTLRTGSNELSPAFIRYQGVADAFIPSVATYTRRYHPGR